MKQVNAATFNADIYMAGDLQVAKQVCREFCFEAGLCVHVQQVDYIYTGGEEAGFKVGLINYPRFPASSDDVRAKAIDLATTLIERLHQWSASIVFPDETVWLTRRPE